MAPASTPDARHSDRRPERFWWAWLVPPALLFVVNIVGFLAGARLRGGTLGLALSLTFFFVVAYVPIFVAGRWYERWRTLAVTAAWRADPTGRAQFRYWDGSGWTEQVSTNGERGYDPI